ncbi:efflux transporter, RND family, MFP subunit [Rhodopseudomonas palustris TIE-1]|uniref:efflux RND transporter periplasmic adaptor subunit n=1 Tax=Rhodopseudomonas palustris TaxID=1076 RepID=UPI000164BE62|nr:efflux RND transporter periplasmic adaptor subunit [Rhodopseudomonas palustris]ACE99600.1 efflux transporter, RND family, MFP subunit [Rhodopseudomonas palustris TIE-1]
MSTKRYRKSIGPALAQLMVLCAGYFISQDASSAQQAPEPQQNMPADHSVPGNSMPPGYTELSVDPAIRQRIGVTLGRATRTPLTMTIRTVGIVRPDETKLAHIHLKTEGWVERLFVSFTGQQVKAGEAMLAIYSPAFFAAQRELLSAARSAQSNLGGMTDQQLVLEAARRRLELWDVPADAIKALEATGRPGTSLVLRSPISGTVLEKKVFQGQYTMPQNELFVVADLSTVWVQGKVFEYELPHVQIGMAVTVALPSSPTQQYTGKVVFIDPVVDEMTRSVQVRVELPNPDGRLKPGMFSQILISHAMGSGLTVPVSAVIRTGERNIAFRAVADDRFLPVQVKISPLRFEDRFQILEGLEDGDMVATSANFLIDSESQLLAGGGGMAGMPGMDDGSKANENKPAARPQDVKGMSMPNRPAADDHSTMKHDRP